MNRFIIQLGRSRLIIFLIISMGFVLGYLSYGINEDVLLTIKNPILANDSLESFKNFKLDFSILDDERYKSLEIFGENPVDPGVTGERKNPFAPIGEE